MSEFFGHPGTSELPAVRSYDPRRGWTIVRRWKGSPVALDAVELVLRSQGTIFERQPGDSNGFGIISATYGADETQSPDEPLADVWTLAGNDLEKSLWELPVVKAELAKIPGDLQVMVHRLALLRSDIESIVRGQTETSNEAGDKVPLNIAEIMLVVTALGMQESVFLDLIRSMASGVESWTISQFVLRHVRTIANNASDILKPTYENVGKVLQTATLTAQEQVPATLKFRLPDGVWLKRTPTVEQATADKWTITQEWWHADSYDAFIYGQAL